MVKVVLDFQEVETLRREMFHWERQARQREQQLAELGKEMAEKSSSLESLPLQLHGTTQQLEEARKRQAEGELNRHVVTPPRAKVRRRWGEAGCR